jgi:hypothetical protein
VVLRSASRSPRGRRSPSRSPGKVHFDEDARKVDYHPEDPVAWDAYEERSNSPDGEDDGYVSEVFDEADDDGGPLPRRLRRRLWFRNKKKQQLEVRGVRTQGKGQRKGGGKGWKGRARSVSRARSPA